MPNDLFEAAGFGDINVDPDCGNKADLPNVYISMAGKKHIMTPDS